MEVKRVTRGPSRRAGGMATPVTRCGVTTRFEARRSGAAAQSDRRGVGKVSGKARVKCGPRAVRG